MTRRWTLRCPLGHEQGVFDSERDARKAKLEMGKCERCRGARRVVSFTIDSHGYVLREFPEHFNLSMGCVVKSRKHHRQLQRERGLQDWQPTKNSPGSQISLGRKS